VFFLTVFDVLSSTLNPFDSHFLEASAGTGKTFAIEHLAVRLIIEGESPCLLEEIVVVTFTRAATRELKRRIYSNLKRVEAHLISKSSPFEYVQTLLNRGEGKRALERIEVALLNYDKAIIHTLHGFCYRLLQECAVDPPFSDPEQERVQPLVEGWVRGMLRDQHHLASYSPFQIRQLLNRYHKDPERLIAALSDLGCSDKRMVVPPSHEELRQGLAGALLSLPAVEAEALSSDLLQEITRYTQMTSLEIPRQIALLSAVVAARGCTVFQFDRLLREELFLERMEEGYLKKRQPTLHPLKYPDLISRLPRALLPWIRKGRDPALTFLRLASEVQQRVQARLKAEELSSPDQLLQRVAGALREPLFKERAQRQFKAAILDEFQDTDPVQWSIVKELFLDHPACTLYLVGDPKQSIYGFRSADVYVYRDALRHMGPASLRHLDTNFRSTPSLVQALNTLFGLLPPEWMALPRTQEALQVPPVLAGSSLPPLDEGAPLTFFVATYRKGRGALMQTHIYPYIVSEILSLKVPYHEIAILVKDRFQAEEVIDALTRAGIPASSKQGTPLTESEAYLSLIDIVRAVESPHDRSLVRAALATPLMGCDAAKLRDRWDEEISRFYTWHTLLKEEGLASFFHALEPPAELRGLIEKILADHPPHLLSYLESLKNEESPSVESQGSVSVMTIFRSKGLEFEVVFPLALASRPPTSDLATIRKEGETLLTLFDAEELSCQALQQEQEAESQRLLYVALTRAKRKLYIPVIHEEGSSVCASPMEIFLHHLGGEERLQPLFPFHHLSLAPLPTAPPKAQRLSSPTPPLPFFPVRPLLSFTALAKEKPASAPLSIPENAPPSAHTLPLGAETGVWIHNLLEKILKRGLHHPFNESAIAHLIPPYLLSWLCELLHTPLAGFSLADIPPDQLQCEVEFLYPHNSAVMKGFADLFFSFEGKYYLLDWKSNYLGPCDSDYTHEKMHEAMQAHQYDLQASIYKEALQRHVQLFDKAPFVFGGAFYVFVRGKAVYKLFI
jgi:exodeoxyribonuclease V beta subunit